MNDGKMSRAMQHLDDELLHSVLDENQALHGKDLKRRHTMKNNQWKIFGSLAAVLALVVATVFLFAQLIGGTAVVALDVNPSIEIEVNSKERVTKVTPLNDEAVTVLSALELENVDLETAVYAILGSMMEHGYLTSDSNSILVSVDADGKRAEALKSAISTKIADTLAGQNIEASVITQTYSHDKDAKAQLVEKIIAAGMTDASGVPYTYEQLIALRVHDLKLILDTKGLTASDMTSSGTAGKGNYISRDEAIAKVLERAQLTAADVTRLQVEVDFDDDYRAMVYEIEFVHDAKEYEYELLAKDGSIVEEEIKAVEVGDRDDDDDHTPLPEGCITEGEALTIALTDAAVSIDDTLEHEIDTDREWGKYVYEVEFDTLSHEYEYLIDAQSGEILDKKVKSQDRD